MEEAVGIKTNFKSLELVRLESLLTTFECCACAIQEYWYNSDPAIWQELNPALCISMRKTRPTSAERRLRNSKANSLEVAITYNCMILWRFAKRAMGSQEESTLSF